MIEADGGWQAGSGTNQQINNEDYVETKLTE
jgi:hypothetical protein